MNEYKECTLTKDEIVEIVIKRLEMARMQYRNFQQKGRYQTEEERISCETRLLGIETLAIELGIIEHGTI